MKEVGLKKIIFWIVIALLLIISFSIAKPYITALISSFILAFLIKPVFNLLSKKLSRKISAGICLLIILIIILIPLVLVLNVIIQQASISLVDSNSSLSSREKSVSEVSIRNIAEKAGVNIERVKQEIISFIISIIKSSISAIPAMLISLLIII